MKSKVIAAFNQVITLMEEVKNDFHLEVEKLRLDLHAEIAELREEILRKEIREEPVSSELDIAVTEYNSLAEIYKTKKAEYEVGKTKELKKEILQIKAVAKPILLRIKELKAEKDNLSEVPDEKETAFLAPVEVRQKKRKTKLENYIIINENESYTTDEVAELNDFMMCTEFSRIKLGGKMTMYCGHCKKETSFDNWVHSIRKRCMKNGLCEETPIPKTCDRQQAVNSLCNPINNKVYPVLRSSKTTDKKKKLYLDAKQTCFDKIGKEIKPYKY